MRTKNQPVNKILLLGFGLYAGRIVDGQINWTPDQSGRWDTTTLADGTPVIEFSGFPLNSVFELHSLNHTVVKLGLHAAAMAISAAAWSWLAMDANAKGKPDFEHVAEQMAGNVIYHIFRSQSSGLTKDERVLIRRYND